MSTVHPASDSSKREVRYLSPAQVVDRYGGSLSLWTVREKARRGELPNIKHAGAKAILFREDWLDQFDDGAELERRVVRRRGLSPGRIVRPKSRVAA